MKKLVGWILVLLPFWSLALVLACMSELVILILALTLLPLLFAFLMLILTGINLIQEEE